MNLRVITVFLILFTQSVSSEEIKWEPRVRDDGIAVVLSSRDGYSSLSEAVASINIQTWIKHVRLYLEYENTNFQNEIHSYMEANYSSELEAALASAGNMHNPKVIALRQAFTEAVLASNYVKTLNAAFSGRCEKITKASYEKFHISQKTEKPRYGAMLWLTTEECT